MDCTEKIFSIRDEAQEMVCVKVIQRMVNGHLLQDPGLAVDGHFGPKTEAGVKAFQEYAKIAVDGVVGPQTWGALHLPVIDAQGKILAYSLIVPVQFLGPKGVHNAEAKHVIVPAVDDTGAFEIALPASTAEYLGLPHLGNIQVGGVNSAVQAYKTVVDIVLGGRTLHGLNAVADPATASFLIGLRFANRYGLEVRVGARTGHLAYCVDLADLAA